MLRVRCHGMARAQETCLPGGASLHGSEASGDAEPQDEDDFESDADIEREKCEK